MARLNPKLTFIVTEDWYFCSHRLPIARGAQRAGFEVSVVTRDDRDGERIRSHGIQVIPLVMRRGEIGPLKDLRTLVTLWQTLRKMRPTLVHNVALKPVVLGTLAARLAGVGGVVNSLTGLGYVFTSRDRKARLLRVLVGTIFRLLFRSRRVHIIVQNPVDKAMVESLGVPPGRVSLISGSGVDVSLFRPGPEPGGQIIAAMVSRMLWDKGVGDLVEAARILQHAEHNVVVRLVGPMDPANPSSIPESTIEGWVRDGIVEWVGPTEDVAAVWANAHIGILPSYREGLPKSLLEAAACGRPLIATNVPGCREVVVQEETGLLIPPRDPKSLAGAIVRLAEDPELRARLGKAARERVEAHFSVDHVVEQTLALYRSIQAEHLS